MLSNVKTIMEAKGVTVRALMLQTGVSSQTVLNARRSGVDGKKGKDGCICNCTLGTLDRIAQSLGVSVHDLFTDQPDKD